jgi:hypothetical protein
LPQTTTSPEPNPASQPELRPPAGLELALGTCFICGALGLCAHREPELVQFFWQIAQRAAQPERRPPGRETGVAIARKAGA